MHDGLMTSGIWHDTAEMPDTLAATLDAAEGFDDVARVLSGKGVRRIVASGNGASYYVAQALWLAAMEGESYPAEVVAVPGGLLARGMFRWREGDVFLAISSSGEFRDVIEAVESPDFPRPFALVTATPESTLGRSADARALVSVPNQRAVTHTQAFCGAVLACLDIWARVAGDSSLSELARTASDLCGTAIEATSGWAADEFDRVETPTAAIVFGTGPGWAAALENALLVKEVARVPCEGVETREGATAAMTGLLPEHLGAQPADTRRPADRRGGGDLQDARRRRFSAHLEARKRIGVSPRSRPSRPRSRSQRSSRCEQAGALTIPRGSTRTT